MHLRASRERGGTRQLTLDVEMGIGERHRKMDRAFVGLEELGSHLGGEPDVALRRQELLIDLQDAREELVFNGAFGVDLDRVVSAPSGHITCRRCVASDDA